MSINHSTQTDGIPSANYDPGELVAVSELSDKTQPANIWQALASVKRTVTYVQKTKPQQGSGISFSYLAIEEVNRKARPVFAYYGILTLPRRARIVDSSTHTNGKGTVSHRVRIAQTIRFLHAGSGTFVDIQTLGESADTSDKACSKAQTDSYKKAIVQVLQIEYGNVSEDTRLAEEIGYDEKMIERARKTIRTASSESDLQSKLASITAHPFSDEQLNELNSLIVAKRDFSGAAAIIPPRAAWRLDTNSQPGREPNLLSRRNVWRG